MTMIAQPDVAVAPSRGKAQFDRPIIVVGAPRSGTTRLGRLLSAHRDVAFLDEWRLTWKFGNDRRSDLLRWEHARPDVARFIRARFAAEVASQGRSRMVEKTPSNALRLPFVDRVFPEARYVHIIRHGMDSTFSIRGFWEGKATGLTGLAQGRVSRRVNELGFWRVPAYWREMARRMLPRGIGTALLGRAEWGPRLPGLAHLVRELHLLEVCALQWRTCVELACAFGRSLPPERYLELRVEEMDESSLRRMLGFCELDEDQGVREFFRTQYEPHRPSDHRQRASREDIEIIRPWLAPTLSWLGYRFDP